MQSNVVKFAVFAIALVFASLMVAAIPASEGLLKRDIIPVEVPTKSNNGQIVPYN
ncbi:hypothetical protein C8Q79DRAFT_1007504 [Trametes meyenii]|nr:hypothetical protein C8Q79DRAFT_1007504 [Trametes meyenii]